MPASKNTLAFIVTILFLMCTTMLYAQRSSCPSCMGKGKPDRYAKLKNRDAKKMMRKHSQQSGTGMTIILPEPNSFTEKKPKKKEKKKRDPNQPILD